MVGVGLLLNPAVAADGGQDTSEAGDDQEKTAPESDAPSATLKAADIRGAWDHLLTNVIPSAEVDPALVVEQVGLTEGAAGDFIDHFFFETASEYIRQETSFSGLPTPTSVINVERGEIANPDGIPFPFAFQPNTDHIYSFMNWGTRGWLSPKLNTNFSFRYRQDLTHVERGSPSLSILNSFDENRRLELLSGTVEIQDLASSGAFAGSSLRIGRQYVYGAELASLDGASLTLPHGRFSVTLFGGRRFTYYSDPVQRAMGGGNLLIRLPGESSLEYQALFYVKGSHTVAFRKRIAPDWLLRTYYKMIGGSPIDYSAQVMYLPGHGRSMVRVSFFQKLSDDDFFYDYTVIARDRDPFNRLMRLNLGPLSPYSQVMVQGRREVLPRVRLGGSFWIRRLNDSQDQNPFLASFEDYRFNLQTFPQRQTELFLEFHQRDTDRLGPLGVTEFDDVSRSGETRVQDFTGELRRTIGEDRLVLTGGAFYRRIALQNRFFFIENARVFGVLGGFSLRLNQRSRLYLDYSLDDDFFIFRPSVRRAHLLRLGVHWRL